MGAKIELAVCNNKYTLFNKIITIAPRFILVNQCEKTVIVAGMDNPY